MGERRRKGVKRVAVAQSSHYKFTRRQVSRVLIALERDCYPCRGTAINLEICLLFGVELSLVDISGLVECSVLK